MRKIWAISTNKGGVLKSSITVNTAGVFSLENKKVLIIDTDNQGNVCLSFGINPDKLKSTLYNVLLEGADPNETIINVHKNIDVLPANDDLAFLDFDVLSKPKDYPEPFSLLKKAIAKIEKQYDYILIDTPPNLGLTQGSVLTCADSVLIPFQPENYSMRSLLKILKAIEDFKTAHNPSLSVLGVLATLVDMRTTLHSQTLQECRQFCLQRGVKMFDTIIPRSVRFASSVAFEGLPATLTDSNNPIVGAYFDFVKELTS